MRKTEMIIALFKVVVKANHSETTFIGTLRNNRTRREEDKISGVRTPACAVINSILFADSRIGR